MKKKNLKSLSLNRKSVSNLNQSLINGAGKRVTNHEYYYRSMWDYYCDPLTANVFDCPDNTLLFGCKSLGACPDSFWC